MKAKKHVTMVLFHKKPNEHENNSLILIIRRALPFKNYTCASQTEGLSNTEYNLTGPKVIKKQKKTTPLIIFNLCKHFCKLFTFISCK